MLLYVDERRFIVKIFNLEEEAKKLFTPNIINTISLIHEYKGKQDLYIESQKDSLTSLLNIAKMYCTFLICLIIHLCLLFLN